MPMFMMRVWSVGMLVSVGLVLVRVGMRSGRHTLVVVAMMAVVVHMGVIVSQLVVELLVPVLFG